MVWEFPAVSHTRYDFWKAKQYTQSGMWWFTLFFGALGLHHYMLRSPQTGMIFFLTNVILCGYPWFYDLIQLSSYGESLEELNEFGLGHPWGPLGMAQGMWRKEDEPEITENDDITVVASAVAAISAAVGAAQKGGGDEPPVEEPAKSCPKDDYKAPSPWFFIIYNLCVPLLSPLAHLVGGNRERAFTRFLYLFATIVFAVVFTVVFGILWIFLPSSVSDMIYGLYPTGLALVSFTYAFAILYDYMIMFVIPSELFFNSKECNLNGFVGFKEDPPCPSTQSPMSVISTVFKPATDVIVPVCKYIYTNVYLTMKSVGTTLFEMTPQGAAIKIAEKTAMGAMAAAAAGAGGKMPAIPGMPSMPPIPGMPKVPSIPSAAKGLPDLKKLQKGGAYSELEPLDYLGGGVIGAVLLGGFILTVFRNVSRRQYWLNDTPPNPRGI